MIPPLVGPKLHSQSKWVCGISYITIPIDVDRDEHIQNCFMTGTVSILSEAGGIINNIAISEDVLQRISFPDDGTLFGSQVFFVNDPIHNKQVIIAKLQDESENSDNEENEYVIKRKFGDTSYCEIRINPKNEAVSITSFGDNPNIQFSSVGGTYAIVSTEVKINAVTCLEQFEQAKQTLVGNSKQYSRVLQNDQGILFELNKFIIGNQDQPMILGKVFKDLFDNFIQAVSEATVMVQGTPMPLLNAAEIAAFKAQTETILSTVGFVKSNSI